MLDLARYPKPSCLLWIFVALTAGLGLSPSSAADPASETPPSPSTGTVTVVQAPTSQGTTTAPERLYAGFGLWIFVDPETGAVVPPTEAQKARRRAFDAALNKSDAGLQPFELDEGGRGVFLAGRFRHAVKVHVGPDGSLSYSCSDHPQGHVAPQTNETGAADEKASEEKASEEKASRKAVLQ